MTTVTQQPVITKSEAARLPKGWRTVPLDLICRIRHGGTPSKEVSSYWTGEIPWASPKDMWVDALSDTEDHISDEAVKNSATSIVPPGSLLVVIRSGILARRLPVVITTQPVAFNQDIKALLVDRREAEPRFLLFALRAAEQKILAEGVKKGATVHSIRSGFLESLPVFLPSLSEQRRIAARLQEQLAEVAKARAAAQAQLDAAQALPAAHLSAVFNSPAAQRWPRRKLGRHVTKIGSGITPLGGHAAYQSSGIPLIRSQNVHMNRFDLAGLAFITPEQDEQMSASRVHPGDVLLNITGASVGRVCTVPSERCPANVNQHVCIIRSDGSFVPQFLSLFLSNPEFQRFIWQSQAGATRQALTKAMIEEFDFPLPPKHEQVAVVDGLESEHEQANSLAKTLTDKLAALDRLPAALLREAFAGRI